MVVREKIVVEGDVRERKKMRRKYASFKVYEKIKI